MYQINAVLYYIHFGGIIYEDRRYKEPEVSFGIIQNVIRHKKGSVYRISGGDINPLCFKQRTP